MFTHHQRSAARHRMMSTTDAPARLATRLARIVPGWIVLLSTRNIQAHHRRKNAGEAPWFIGCRGNTVGAAVRATCEGRDGNGGLTRGFYAFGGPMSAPRPMAMHGDGPLPGRSVLDRKPQSIVADVP